MSTIELVKSPAQSCAGYSLIELMIASLIGLLLMAGIIQIFISSRATYSSVTAQSQISENGRIGMIMIAGNLRHAGYWDDVTVSKTFAPGQGFELDAALTGIDNETGDVDVVDDTDVITVRFNGAFDGGMTTCKGDTVNDGQVAIQRLFIRPAQVDENERSSSLVCDTTVYTLNKPSGLLTVPSATERIVLINGIENMQVLYTSSEDGKFRTVRADEVTDWTRIDSVTVALLSSTGDTVIGPPRVDNYTLLDETVPPAGDGKPRQVFVQTVQLRNVAGVLL